MSHTPSLASLLLMTTGPLLLLAVWVVTIAIPFAFFSLVRNVAKTRRALERIADAMELPSRAGGSGVLKL